MPNKELLENLERALQALASPADIQTALFPAYVCHGDELVLDFDEIYRFIVENEKLLPEQEAALRKLDEYLDSISGEEFVFLYNGPEGLTCPEWDMVRGLAKSALKSFGWEYRTPPPNPNTYYTKNQ
jgi:hypothetical protein